MKSHFCGSLGGVLNGCIVQIAVLLIGWEAASGQITSVSPSPALGLALNESAILLQAKTSLKFSTKLPDVQNTWDGTVCDGNISRWSGVTCTFGHVVKLNLTYTAIGGVVPVPIYKLPRLQTFICIDCNLTGPLPAEWALAPALKEIHIENSPLQSTLPPAWGNITTLKDLTLRNNGIYGTLPPQWSNLKNLKLWDMTENNLTGTLPPSFGQMTSLNRLMLVSNNLTGTLPASWNMIGSGNQDPVDLGLSFNPLAGTLPPEWGAWDGLTNLYMGGNMFSGPVPAEWCNRTNFLEIEIFGNSLNGSLPACFGNFTGLTVLWLQTNSFSGTLPAVWGGLTNLASLQVGRNKLTGTLPPSWGNLESLNEISVKENQLTGTLPVEWASLRFVTVLGLANNLLTGSLPGKEWAVGMTSAERVFLRQNPLSGSLPESWFNTPDVWPQLSAMDIRYTNVSGPVPEISNGSTFFSSVGHTPKLFIAPDPSAISLCGPLPNPGPLFYTLPGTDTNPSDSGDLVTELPPCRGSPPGQANESRWKTIIVTVLLAVIALAVAVFFLVRAQKRAHEKAKSGSSMGSSLWKNTSDTFRSFIRSGTPRTSLGTGKGSDYATTPTSGMTPLTGSGHTPSPVPSSGSATDSARGGHGTITTSSSLRSGSKTSSLEANASRQRNMKIGDLIFAADSATGRRIALGSGAFGQVYKASWHGTDVAVKVLKDEHSDLLLEGERDEDIKRHKAEQEQQFQNEARLLSNLRHPNIVNFLGFLVNSDEMMVVTELCDGGDLSKAIKRHRGTKAMGWYMRGAKIALDIACGLAYLHTRGIIHYDIKPGNILLDKLGSTAKISDVGLSKSLATLAGTASNTLRGTLEYMAPELIVGLRSTFAVDIYSFGVMLLEIITGEAPDKRNGPGREPRIPEECPEGAFLLYKRCMDPVPEKRPTAQELVDSLRKLQPPPRVNPAAAPKDAKLRPKPEAAPALDPTPDAAGRAIEMAAREG